MGWAAASATWESIRGQVRMQRLGPVRSPVYPGIVNVHPVIGCRCSSCLGRRKMKWYQCAHTFKGWSNVNAFDAVGRDNSLHWGRSLFGLNNAISINTLTDALNNEVPASDTI